MWEANKKKFSFQISSLHVNGEVANTQTDRQTDKRWVKHNLNGRGITTTRPQQTCVLKYSLKLTSQQVSFVYAYVLAYVYLQSKLHIVFENMQLARHK